MVGTSAFHEHTEFPRGVAGGGEGGQNRAPPGAQGHLRGAGGGRGTGAPRAELTAPPMSIRMAWRTGRASEGDHQRVSSRVPEWGPAVTVWISTTTVGTFRPSTDTVARRAARLDVVILRSPAR